VNSENSERTKAGKLTRATGKARIRSDFTRDEITKGFAVLHLGDHNISGGLGDFQGEAAFSLMRNEIHSAFERGDTTEIVHLMDKHFGTNNFSIWHLFREEQRKVINQILESAHVSIEAAFRKIYEDNNPVMNFLSSINIIIPKSIFLAAEHIVNLDLKRLFEKEDVDIERLKQLIQESTRWNINLDRVAIEYNISLWVTSVMEKAWQDPTDPFIFERITDVLKLLEPLSLNLNFWKAQNMYFSLKERLNYVMVNETKKADRSTREWQDALNDLGDKLHMRVDL
jgi:hypothetical protein